MQYHLYWIDEANRVTARYFFAEPDDVAALDSATKLCTETRNEIEVWQGPRFVARLAQDGTASKAIPKPRENAA
jgi:hypothetical protein